MSMKLTPRRGRRGRFGVEDFDREKGRADIGAECAADVGAGVVDIHSVAGKGEEPCGGETGGPGADDRYAFAGGVGLCWQIGMVGGQVGVAYKTFEAADGDCAVEISPAATFFAEFGTNAPEGGGEGNVTLDDFGGAVKFFGRNKPEHFVDVHVRGTDVLAWCRTVPGVFAEE